MIQINFWGILIETWLTLHWIVLCFRARPGKLPRMGWGRRAVALTSPGSELILPPAATLDAKLLAVLVPVTDQQLAARPDHMAGSVEDLPVIQEGYQVLLLVIPGTVHINGVEAGKGKETTSDESPPPVRPNPSSWPSVSEATTTGTTPPGDFLFTLLTTQCEFLFPVLFLAGTLFSP